MLLITILVEFRVVAGRSRTRAGSPQAVSRWLCCAVAFRTWAGSPQAVSRRSCCAVAFRRAWHGRSMGMASVNQTRPHCVNQMGKTHSKPLAARHTRRTTWARHAMCVNRPLMDQHQVRDHATQTKGMSIHKNGSPAAVLGQTSMPDTSQATQNPQNQPCLPLLPFYYAILRKQQMHVVCESEELPTAGTS